MKKLILILSLINFYFVTDAQNVKQSGPPNAGSFYVTITTAKGQERMNVNYALTPETLTTELTLHLDCWEPMLLSAKILNAKNATILSWMPSQAAKDYSHQFDISNLAVGNYKMEIYGPKGNKVQTVNFEKQTGSN